MSDYRTPPDRSDDGMPRDPFEVAAGAFGVVNAILAQGALINSALEEAHDRGRLVEAVDALDIGDLRALAIRHFVATRGFGRGGSRPT